jgi:hypothetical protein
MFVSLDRSVTLPDPTIVPHVRGILLKFNLNATHSSLAEIQCHRRWIISNAPGLFEILDFNEIENKDSLSNTVNRQTSLLARYVDSPSFIDLLAENLNMFQDDIKFIHLPQIHKKRFNLEI